LRRGRCFDPQVLYRQWEDSQWSPWEFDLSADRDQWKAIEDRSLVMFVLGSLMVAEERITTKFSGLVGADGSEEEVTFLATQQVDEARHIQFYARYQNEVVSKPAVTLVPDTRRSDSRARRRGRKAGLRVARDLLDSDYPAHQRAGRVLYAAARQEAPTPGARRAPACGPTPRRDGRSLPGGVRLRRSVGPTRTRCRVQP
jgi:hypothetical protein